MMKCTKEITITGFLVKYVDLREPKPRHTYEEIYTVENDWLEALKLLRLVPADVIRDRYEKIGLKAFRVERITPKRTITLDLNAMWAVSADQNAPKELE